MRSIYDMMKLVADHMTRLMGALMSIFVDSGTDLTRQVLDLEYDKEVLNKELNEALSENLDLRDQLYAAQENLAWQTKHNEELKDRLVQIRQLVSPG